MDTGAGKNYYNLTISNPKGSKTSSVPQRILEKLFDQPNFANKLDYQLSTFFCKKIETVKPIGDDISSSVETTTLSMF